VFPWDLDLGIWDFERLRGQISIAIAIRPAVCGRRHP
jgi:hypothetical protein